MENITRALTEKLDDFSIALVDYSWRSIVYLLFLEKQTQCQVQLVRLGLTVDAVCIVSEASTANDFLEPFMRCSLRLIDKKYYCALSSSLFLDKYTTSASQQESNFMFVVPVC